MFDSMTSRTLRSVHLASCASSGSTFRIPIFEIDFLKFLPLLVDLSVLSDLTDFGDLEETRPVAYEEEPDAAVVAVVNVSGVDGYQWLFPFRLSGGGVAGTSP